MPWVDAVPAVVVALTVLYWPIPVVLWAFRLPPLAATAIAPAIGVLVLVTSAVVADVVGAPWGWPWVLGVAAVLTGASTTARLLLGRRPDASPVPHGLWSVRVLGTYLAGIALAGVVLIPTILDALVGPDAFSQRYDNVFHLNATHLAAKGHASTFDFSPLTAPGFYPAAWHDWAAFVVQLSGASVLVAAQACTLVVVLVVWPLTVAWFVEVVCRPGVTGRLALGPLALSSVSFPLMLAAWGTIYPNLLGLALAPAAFAAGWDAIERRESPALGLRSALTVAVLTGAAVTLAHPNAVLSVGLLLLPVAAVALWPLVRHGDLGTIRGSRLATLAVGAFVVGFPIVWWLSGRSIAEGSTRVPFTTVELALAEAVTGTSLGRPVVAPLTIGLVLGLLAAAILPRLRPLIACFLLALAAYVAAAALQTSPGVLLLTAPYYTDPYRIAAMGTLVAVPLAVLGWDTLARVVGEHTPLRPHAIAAVGLAAGLAAALVTATAVSPGFSALHDEVRKSFVADAEALVLTPDERAIIERLPLTTEPDAILVVNPYQGGSLAFALADRRVTDYYMNTKPSPAGAYLAAHLREAASDPEVCAAVHETGARYALVLEPSEIPGPLGREFAHAGLTGLDLAPGFEVVDTQGATALYRITACG